MEDENASKQEAVEGKKLNEQEAAEYEHFKKYKALMNNFSYIQTACQRYHLSNEKRITHGNNIFMKGCR